jgi:hypothetical protein
MLASLVQLESQVHRDHLVTWAKTVRQVRRERLDHQVHPDLQVCRVRKVILASKVRLVPQVYLVLLVYLDPLVLLVHLVLNLSCR